MILQQPIETRTSSGGVNVVWRDVDDGIWAAIHPLRGIQLFYAQQLQSPADTRILIRYWKGLHTGWRLVDYDNPAAQYVIQAFPRDMDYKHTIVSLECQMLQAGTV